MKLQILGTGCPKCKKLAANAEEALQQAGVQAEVEKVTDVMEIAKFRVLSTPGLAIDGEVKCAGKIATPDQIAKWVTATQD